jgi:hypothetical protein
MIKAAKSIHVRNPEIPYGNYLMSLSISENVQDGRIVQFANVRLVPYREVDGDIEQREDLAQTISWSSATAKNKKMEALIAKIETALTALEA